MADAVTALLDELQAELIECRETNGNLPTEVEFVEGNIQDETHAGRPARVSWIWESITIDAARGEPQPEGEPKAAKYLVAHHCVRILHKDREQCVALLMDLVTASFNLPIADRFVWENGSGAFITQMDGKLKEGGLQLLEMHVALRIPIPAEPVGTTVEVTVADTQFRSGVEDPPGETEAQTAYEVNEWVTPKKYSDS